MSETESGVVMVSGGADSVALLLGLAEVLDPNLLVVLHVNYGLRDTSGEDELLVRRHCEELGVACEVHRAGAPAGNLQAWAREIRHREAERIRADGGMDWIAIGHNQSDLAETFLYRLASSPGVRSLLAMPPRSGYLIRPLLALDRARIRSMLEGVAEYADDPTNQDPAFARNRIRLEVIPALERVNRATELNIARTRAELEEDEEALSLIAVNAVLAGWDGPEDGIRGELIAEQSAAVGRRMIRHLAEAKLGRPIAVTPETTADALRLAGGPEGGRLDLGGGASLVIEAGRISVGAADEDESVTTPVPVETGFGSTRFGGWEIEAAQTTEREARAGFGNPWTAFLDLDEAAPWVRAWRSGDRIEPLGMSGSKSLQDVFTDALVLASRRHSWPVLVVDETVIWVPGLVRSRHLLIGGPDKPVLRLEAHPPFSI